MTTNAIIKEYIGRTLTGSKFGINQEGCQSLTVPQKVTGARLGTTDGDPCVWLTLKNGEEAYFYTNDEIYFAPLQ